jgi:DNA-binding HxlR family transcriptional regulator
MSADAQPNVLDVRFPTRRILAIIGDKWTTVVLYCLSIREHRRFNELQKQIPDISKKMLIQTLRNLERDGLLERTVYRQVPPKTEYRLTDNGHKLREPIAWLCEWGMSNQELIDGIIEVRAGLSSRARNPTAPSGRQPISPRSSVARRACKTSGRILP